MAIKAIKPRTTRMSFVCNGERGEGYFRGIIQKYNEDQKRLLAQKKAANPNSRVAPLFVGKLYYVVVKGKTQCLAYTQGGDQFEFSKWYEFISASFQDVEAMEDHDKFEQIKSFGRNLQRYACIKFEESLPSKRGADELDSGHAQTPAKQMALGDSFQPVRVGDGVMKQSRIIAVTVDCGAKQNLKFDGVGEDVRESSGDAVDNLFRKPDDDYVRKALTAFLTGKVPIYKPAKVIEGGAPGEKASDKCIRGKRSLNGSSAGWKCIQTMFSLVVKTSQGRDVLHGKLSPKHMEDLMCLDRLLNPVSWQGVLTGYMQPDSQELRYDIPLPGVDAEIARRACFTELWRRALNLEGALAKMTLFFATIIGRTPAAGLSVVSRQTVANVAALISAGAGLYPEDGCFWKKRVPDYIQKLSSIEGDRDKDVSALIDWLADNRGNAFIALHPKAHELDVLLPAMAYIYSIRESLGNLRDLDALKQILDDLRLEIQSRTELYASCCAWLVVYGAKLTSLLSQAKSWIDELKPLCDASTPIPIITLHSLSKDGKVIGVDGRALNKGHVDDDWIEGFLPFPGCCLTVKPLPVEELRRNCEARNQVDTMMINDMLSKLGLDEKCAAIKLKEVGDTFVDALFAGDSHTKMRTHFLPPTASMPEACHAPDQVYKVSRA